MLAAAVSGGTAWPGRQAGCTDVYAGFITHSWPNKGVQATAASVRSCLAPAARRA